MIIMARILTPDDYGLVAMLTIFIAISQSLVDSGFSNALIRKLDKNETDNSTVFYFNVASGFLIYFLLYYSAPYIAKFYNEPLLIPITRVISWSIVINSLVVVQRALLTSRIDFKTQAKASFPAAIISGIVGIYLAYNDFGVWSIVWYQLTNLIVNAILLWWFSKWHPSFVFSWCSFKELFGFGSKLAISGVIETVYQNVYLIIIGKVYSASDLGYYTRSSQFAQFPSSNLTGILQRVTYPVLCSLQNDNVKLKNVYRRFLRLSAFIIFPLMIGLAAVAKPLILLLLNEQWIFSIILLQIICFSMMWYPIHSLNLNLLQALGRSELFLRLEIIKKSIGITILCITVPLGIIAMCIGSVLCSIIFLVVNTYYTGKLINVGFIQQIRDIFPSFLYSLSMGIIVYTIIDMFSNLLLQLVFGIIIGILYYLLITKFTHSKDLQEVIEFLKEVKH